MNTNRLKILNTYEELTYQGLKTVCEKNGVKVFPKIRVADVLNIAKSGIPDVWFTYALKAHFDFTIVDKEQMPLFCVEYDGKQHGTDLKQIENDRIKDSICDQLGISILRINSKYVTKKYRGLNLLTYFIEAWFLEEAFTEAQENGDIPFDEVFDMNFILHDGLNKNKKWPYWISHDIQMDIRLKYDKKIIVSPSPSSYVGIDNLGNYHCISWVEINATTAAYAISGMKMKRFPSVVQSELLEMLTIFDLNEQIKKALAGNNTSRQDINVFYNTTLRDFCNKYSIASASYCMERAKVCIDGTLRK